MLEFVIEKETGEEIISVSVKPNDKNAIATYNVERILECYNAKYLRKKISILDYKKLCDEIEALSFEKVFAENKGRLFLDGWTLRFAIQSGSTVLKVEVQCPDENAQAPETAKLLTFCKKIFALVEA